VDDITKGFATLFQGRTDVYGSWEGGCIKGLVDESRFVKHLWGQEYIGIYPLVRYRHSFVGLFGHRC
jgi:hypothetical protein